MSSPSETFDALKWIKDHLNADAFEAAMNISAGDVYERWRSVLIRDDAVAYRLPKLIRECRDLQEALDLYAESPESLNGINTLLDDMERLKHGLAPLPTVRLDDPQGFLDHFTATNPNADPVIVQYITEAVLTFNAGCPKASTVMMGCASEQAIIVLHETFKAKISDTAKKQQYEKQTENAPIARLYDQLHDRLTKMAAKKFDRALAETLKHEFPGMFQLVRKQRNAAGHPELVGEHDPKSVVFNLRLMTEYVRRVYLFIDFFKTNPADW